MKKAIFLVSLLLVVLPLGGCVSKFAAYLDGKHNEKLALEYVSDTYGIEAEIISSWAGHTDFLDGRSPDAFVMKESSEDGFPFRIEVFEEKILDEYPCSFIGNEISKKVFQCLDEKYSETIDFIKCHVEVNTDETELLTDMAKINELPDSSIRISLYIVSSETIEVHQDMLCVVYQYLQETFDAFYLEFYILEEKDFHIMEEYFNENVRFLSSFEMLGIRPFSGFEYYKGTGVKDLEREEIISMFEVFNE